MSSRSLDFVAEQRAATERLVSEIVARYVKHQGRGVVIHLTAGQLRKLLFALIEMRDAAWTEIALGLTDSSMTPMEGAVHLRKEFARARIMGDGYLTRGEVPR
jgi:hypothetical protein